MYHNWLTQYICIYWHILRQSYMTHNIGSLVFIMMYHVKVMAESFETIIHVKVCY
jgi:hypothetical protein